MSGFSLVYVIYAAAALTGIMIAEAFYMLYAGRSDRRAAINRRMKLQENKISQEQVLIQLRKERGLEGGASLLFVRSLSRAAHPIRPGHADAAVPDDHVGRRRWRWLCSRCGKGCRWSMRPLGVLPLAAFIPLIALRFLREAPPQAVRHPASGSAGADHPQPEGRASRSGGDRDGGARNARSDRHRVRRRRRRGDLRLRSRLGAAVHVCAGRPRGSAAVRHRGIDPEHVGRQSARDPRRAGDRHPRARQAAPQGAGDFDRRPHVGLHPDRRAGAADGRHHGADAAILFGAYGTSRRPGTCSAARWRG